MEPLDPDAFEAAVASGAIVIDIRPWEVVARHPIPSAVHAPLEQIQAGRLPDVPRDAVVVVVCEWGRKSELGALYLEAHGFSRVRHLLGGVELVRRRGSLRGAKPGRERR